MQDVLRKWTPREKMCDISKFADTLSFVIIPGMSWQNFVCHYPWNVLAKFHENPSNLHTL